MIETGSIGKALYFYKRLLARNQNSSRYRTICNQECLVLLIDEINNQLFDENFNVIYNPEIAPKKSLRMKEMAQAISFLAKIATIRINTEISKRIICALTIFIQKYFTSTDFNSGENMDDKLFLINSFYNTGLFLKDKSYLKHATDGFVAIAFNNTFYNTPTNNYILNKFFKLTGKPFGEKILIEHEQNILDQLLKIEFLFGPLAIEWRDAWAL